MAELPIAVATDLQASQPRLGISLTRAGVTGLQQVLRMRQGGSDRLYYAEVSCSVDLDPGQKGVHMSRFPELLAEVIESVVTTEALKVEHMAEHIATRIRERQGALRSEVRIEARYPVERLTPVTGLPTQEIFTLIGIAAAGEAGSRRAVGVRVRGMNACPCAQGLVRDAARPRLAELGYGPDEQEAIFGALPAATHNQRGEATLILGTGERVWAEDLSEIAEASMSAPIFTLLKRPDERHVVEQAHLHPRFVEDSVREMIGRVLERYPSLDDGCFVSAHQINFETIHDHEVEAERTGTFGDLRGELSGDGRPGEHRSLAEWLREGSQASSA